MPKYKNFKKIKNNDGFTLVEILIVILLLGILAYTVMPNFVGFDREAKEATTKSNLASLRTAISLYRAKMGQYPDHLEELVKSTFIDKGAEKPFMKEIPVAYTFDEDGKSIQSKEVTIGNPDQGELTVDNVKGGWLYNLKTRDVYVNSDYYSLDPKETEKNGEAISYYRYKEW